MENEQKQDWPVLVKMPDGHTLKIYKNFFLASVNDEGTCAAGGLQGNDERISEAIIQAGRAYEDVLRVLIIAVNDLL